MKSYNSGTINSNQIQIIHFNLKVKKSVHDLKLIYGHLQITREINKFVFVFKIDNINLIKRDNW